MILDAVLVTLAKGGGASPNSFGDAVCLRPHQWEFSQIMDGIFIIDFLQFKIMVNLSPFKFYVDVDVIVNSYMHLSL